MNERLEIRLRTEIKKAIEREVVGQTFMKDGKTNLVDSIIRIIENHYGKN